MNVCFIVPPLEPRTCIPGGNLPAGAFTRFLKITRGGKRNGVKPSLVRLTPAMSATVNRKRSCPVVLSLIEYVSNQMPI